MKTLKEILDPNRLSTILLYTSIISFIIAFNFTDNPPAGGWYQQFLPYLNNRPLSDITFLDSLTGYGITGDGTVGDTNYIIKTTNGGDNWFIVNSIYRDLSSVSFINQNTGFVCGGFNAVGGIVIKTTNGGNNWFSLNASFANHFTDMFVLSEDTIWLTDDNGFNGGLFKTNNGGLNWITQYHGFGSDPEKIYMFNSQIGFMGISGTSLQKTTNGGNSWFPIASEGTYRDMYFSDSLTGWKAIGSIKKTTDGGITWVTQTLPLTTYTGIRDFSNVNSDTIWGVGGSLYHPGFAETGIIYRTTNGGINWGYQVPDSNFNISKYLYIDFVKKLNGWSYSIRGVHTVGGGDSLTIYTGIKNNNLNISKSFTLYQNYPNPFNPATIISYKLEESSDVILKVYNIKGGEVNTLVKKKQNPGKYNLKFDGSKLSTGVYLYCLELFDKNGYSSSETKKMVLLR